MQRNRKLSAAAMFLAALLTSLFFVGTAHGQAQFPAYKGKFTLPYQVWWGGSVLQPGEYTVTVKSTGSPIIALVRTADGDAVTHVVSGSVNRNTDGLNALLIRERGGKLIVHSLALADLGVVLVYDPSLAREPVKEAQVKRSIPVMIAKR